MVGAFLTYCFAYIFKLWYKNKNENIMQYNNLYLLFLFLPNHIKYEQLHQVFSNMQYSNGQSGYNHSSYFNLLFLRLAVFQYTNRINLKSILVNSFMGELWYGDP